MKKFRFYINFDKEEKWLEDMAKQGWQLKKQHIFYTFVSAPPEKEKIKIDFRMFSKESNYLEYQTLFKDSGWQHIAGSKSSGNQYFKRIDKNSYEDIFSDDVSRAGRYKRLSYFMLMIAIMFIPLVIYSGIQGTLGLDLFFNPRLLYLTPGLWDMNGTDFWRRFIFETPFAIMRGLSTTISFMLILSYFILTIKSLMIYQKAMKDNPK
jgi:hypothetical protein